MLKPNRLFLLIIALMCIVVPCCIAETAVETGPIPADLGFSFDEFARRSSHGVIYALDGRNMDVMVVSKSKATQDMQSKEITVQFEDTTVVCILSTNPNTGNIASIQVIAPTLTVNPSATSIMEWLFTVAIPCPADGKKLHEIEDDTIASDTRQWMSLRSNVVSTCRGLYQTPKSPSAFYVVNDIVFTCMEIDWTFIFYVTPIISVNIQSAANASS